MLSLIVVHVVIKIIEKKKIYCPAVNHWTLIALHFDLSKDLYNLHSFYRYMMSVNVLYKNHSHLHDNP